MNEKVEMLGKKTVVHKPVIQFKQTPNSPAASDVNGRKPDRLNNIKVII